MKNKLSRLIVCLTLFTLSASVMAVTWEKKSFSHDNFTLPYRIYQPDVAEKAPLVIHLHGSGEAGVDNEAQLYLGLNVGPDYFASDSVQAIQKAFVLAPQTPKAMRWANTSLADYDFSTTPSTLSMSALLVLIDKLVAENPKIDASRVYMTGLSRGGQGVWNAAMQRPHLFAAIVPIAGSGSPTDASLLLELPIWAFHGDSDSITSTNYTRDMINSIIQAGGTTSLVRYSEVQDGEHQDAWLTAFKDTKLYNWMLSKRN